MAFDVHSNDLMAAVLAVVGIADGVIARFYVDAIMAKNPKATPRGIHRARITLYIASATMLALAYYFYHVEPPAVKH